ncbi:M81 family metallopeptidase [Devosia sp.]|uniref:M81 family metallopeptidase n=1 Tax=Devosia sp. TaxID=1871048 RepID=UPI003A8D3C1A
MTKTILFGGLYHETHTFLAQKTGLKQFEVSGINLGADVVEKNRGNGSPSAGFIDHAEREGWRIVPTIQLSANPAGKVTDEVVVLFLSHFLDGLDRHMAEIDGIYLVLHGAMVSESSDDVEGLVLKTIRERLVAAGRGDLPVAAVLDLHGNISEEMVENATVLRAYRENPHTDAYEAAVATAELLGVALEEPGLKQVHRATQYVLPPTGVGTADKPMKSVLAAARAIEAKDPDILSISVMAGYAYSDIAICGFSLNCLTRGSTNAAAAHLDDLVKVLEADIGSGYPHEDSLDAALSKADALPPGKGPVLLIEAADNIGGGTPGDATGLLAPLLAAGRTGVLAAIADGEAVAACFEVGVGATVRLSIGGKTDAHHGAPMPFEGVVKSLSDGVFELENKHSHMASMGGTTYRMGRCAVVENAQAKILLSERKTAPMDLGQYHSQGLRPEDASYVVIKAAVSHRAAYDPIQRASFNVDSPGLCTSDLTRLPYTKLRGKTIALD